MQDAINTWQDVQREVLGRIQNRVWKPGVTSFQMRLISPRSSAAPVPPSTALCRRSLILVFWIAVAKPVPGLP